MVIVSDFFSTNKPFILLTLPLYKKLCEDVILRGRAFFLLQFILQIALTFIAHLK